MRTSYLAITATILGLAYPLLVYFSLQRWEPRLVALLLANLILLRLALTSQKKNNSVALLSVPVIICLSGGLLLNNDIFILLTPVAINLTFLCLFIVSIINPPSIIERFARLREPDLDQQGVCYTRRVTFVWSYFFLFNGCVALYTALFCSYEAWTLYNGLIGYILMGTLFLAEFALRKRLRGKNTHD